MDEQISKQDNLQEVFLNVIEADFNNHLEEYNPLTSSDYIAPWQVFDEPQ